MFSASVCAQVASPKAGTPEAGLEKSQSNFTTFNPRVLRGMPRRLEIPDPGMSPEEVQVACLKYFGGTKYKAAVSVEGDKSREQLWNDTIFGKFLTDGKTFTHDVTGRPTCSVTYEASTRYRSSTYARGGFDGRTLYYYVDAKTPGTEGYVIRPLPDGKMDYVFYWQSSGKQGRVTMGTFERD